MANGDAAAAAGMDLVASTDDRRDGWDEINKTRDYIAERTNAVTPVEKGGTGGVTVAEATANLHVWRNSGATAPGTTPSLGWNGVRLVYEIPGYAFSTELARLADIPSGSGLADGPTSGAYARAATGPATWYAVWMNAANQFMRNTSSRRYKKNIRDWAPPAGGIMGLRTVIFDRKGDDAPVDEVGFIAEEVLEVLPDGVAYYEGEVDGLNDRAIIAALVNHVQELTRRIEILESS